LMVYFSGTVAIIFPDSSIVFRVRQNVADEDLLRPIVDPGNQAALVVADFEADATTDGTEIPSAVFDVRGVAPTGAFRNRKPGNERGLPLRMGRDGFANPGRLQDANRKSSHFAKIV
jgi:hypothetical protein